MFSGIVLDISAAGQQWIPCHMRPAGPVHSNCAASIAYIFTSLEPALDFSAPNYTAWWQKHMGVSNLPRAVTLPHFSLPGWELNPQPVDYKSDALLLLQQTKYTHTHATAFFQDYPGGPVPER